MKNEAAGESKTRTKLQRLVAVYDRFHASLEELPGDVAAAFVSNWKSYRSRYVDIPAGVRPSQLAAGLEQGLRELPILIQPIDDDKRPGVSRALQEAIRSEYPEFLTLQQSRLSKILERNRISTESEFMLVRHIIDIGESQRSETENLRTLYGLIDAFESKKQRYS
jgi:hypothetical protein